MTRQVQPETIFRDLYEGVAGALHGRPTNELEMMRWARDAESLLRVSRAEGLEVKAVLAALDDDDGECDRLYELALKSTADYAFTLLRYFDVLSNRLRPQKLFEVFQASGDCRKGSPDVTRHMEGIMAREGFMVSAWKLAEELKLMNSHSCAHPGDSSERATQVVDSDGHSDSDFGVPVAFAKKFLAEKKVGVQAFNVGGQVDEEGRSSVFFQISTDQTPAEAADLEWELYDALESQQFPAEADGKLILGLTGNRAELS